MTVRQLTRIALLACIEQVVFGCFTEILYLECITLTIVLFALVFDRKEAFWAAITFGILNMLVKQGVTPWSMMYLVIYPMYTLLVSLCKKGLLKHRFLIVLLTGFLSFLTGQLLQIPTLLFSKIATIYYIIVGLKTSIIQGVVSAVTCSLIFTPLYRVLYRLERKTPYEKNN